MFIVNVVFDPTHPTPKYDLLKGISRVYIYISRQSVEEGNTLPTTDDSHQLKKKSSLRSIANFNKLIRLPSDVLLQVLPLL